MAAQTCTSLRPCEQSQVGPSALESSQVQSTRPSPTCATLSLFGCSSPPRAQLQLAGLERRPEPSRGSRPWLMSKQSEAGQQSARRRETLLRNRARARRRGGGGRHPSSPSRSPPRPSNHRLSMMAQRDAELKAQRDAELKHKRMLLALKTRSVEGMLTSAMGSKARTYLPTCIHTCTCTYLPTCIHTCTCTYLYAYKALSIALRTWMHSGRCSSSRRLVRTP